MQIYKEKRCFFIDIDYTKNLKIEIDVIVNQTNSHYIRILQATENILSFGIRRMPKRILLFRYARFKHTSQEQYKTDFFLE